MNRKLRSYLRRRGASPDEIAQAEREGWLALLAFDRLLMPGAPRYTFAQVAARAGIPVELASRVWRALGFPDPAGDAAIFTERDAEAMATVVQLPADNLVPSGDGDDEAFDELVQQVRVIGGSLAKIAEVQSDNVLRAVREREASGFTDEEIAELLSRVDFERVEQLLAYALRLQLRDAVWRRLAGSSEGDADRYAVGFVDLVGYTALSQELDNRELAALVERFEALAYDTVAQYGGRVVKTIGDEVMFVTSDARAAARIALRLTERSVVDDILPDARAGLAFGQVLAHEGDYYGPVVNLARRFVELARPGTAICSDAAHDALEGDLAFTWRKLRTRRLRDFGAVALWKLESVTDTAELPLGGGDGTDG